MSTTSVCGGVQRSVAAWPSNFSAPLPGFQPHGGACNSERGRPGLVVVSVIRRPVLDGEQKNDRGARAGQEAVRRTRTTHSSTLLQRKKGKKLLLPRMRGLVLRRSIREW